MSPHVAATTPYPWPFDADLDPAGTALLIIREAGMPPMPTTTGYRVADLARAVRTGGGRVVLVRTREALSVAPTAAAVETPGAAATHEPAGSDIVSADDINRRHHALGTHDVRGARDGQALQGLRAIPNGHRTAELSTTPDVISTNRLAASEPRMKPHHCITSAGHDGFFDSTLEQLLRRYGIHRLLLVGGPLETSVHSTMRSANDRGFECLLVADACWAIDPDLAPAAISMIEMSGGIFGAVGRSSRVVAAIEVLLPGATA